MKKLVRGLNVNTAVAFAFTALALLYSLGRLIFLFAAFGYYDTQYVILNSLCALTLGASELLFCMGVVNKNKTRKLLLWSAITAGSAIVLYSLYVLLDYSKVISSYNTFISVLAAAQVAFSSNYLGVLFALSISIAAAVLMSLYVSGKLKNKILVKSFLVAGWFLCLIQMICYKMEGGLFLTPVLIMFAAYLLLLSSNDIFSADTEVSIPEVVLLSIVTFGVYFIIWMASIVKKTRLIEEKEGSYAGEVLSLLICPYWLFWLPTRAEMLSEEADDFDIKIKDRSGLYIALFILGFGIVDAALIQNDLNKIARSLEEEGLTLEFSQNDNAGEVLAQMPDDKDNLDSAEAEDEPAKESQDLDLNEE